MEGYWESSWLFKENQILSLQYSKFPIILERFTGANWISSTSDNKSTLGWMFTLRGCAVSKI